MNLGTEFVIKSEPNDEMVIDIKKEIEEAEENVDNISSPCFECLDCKIYFQTYDEFKDHTKNQHKKIYLDIIKNNSEDMMEVAVEKKIENDVSATGLKLEVINIKKEVEEDLLILNETSRGMGNSKNNKNNYESNSGISGKNKIIQNVLVNSEQCTLNNIKEEVDEDMLIPNGTPREPNEDSVLFFECIECNKKFKTYEEFKDHKRLTHNEHHYVDTMKNQTDEKISAILTESFETNSRNSSNLLIPNGGLISGENKLLQNMHVSSEQCTLNNNIKQEGDEDMLIPNGTPRELENDSVRYFKCDGCKKEFKTYDEFKDHKRLIHNEHHYADTIKNQTNEHADTIFTVSFVTNTKNISESGEFVQILQNNENTNIIDDDSQQIKSKYSKALKNYLENIKQKSTSSKILNSDANLTTNKSSVNLITILFQCIYCKLNFISDIELTKHQEIEHKTQPLVKDASKQMNVNLNVEVEIKGTKRAPDVKDWPANLVNHFVPDVHGKCEECGDLFASKKELNKHYNLEHVKRWKYECHVCKMKFNYSRHLKRHFPKHFGETYNCDKCNKQYRRKTSLLHHQQVQHKMIDEKL